MGKQKYIRGIDIHHPDPAKDIGRVMTVDMSVLPREYGVGEVMKMIQGIGIIFSTRREDIERPVAVYTGRGGMVMADKMLKPYRVYHRLMGNYGRHSGRNWKKGSLIHSKMQVKPWMLKNFDRV